jgi:hypothetical protein
VAEVAVQFQLDALISFVSWVVQSKTETDEAFHLCQPTEPCASLTLRIRTKIGLNEREGEGGSGLVNKSLASMTHLIRQHCSVCHYPILI